MSDTTRLTIEVFPTPPSPSMIHLASGTLCVRFGVVVPEREYVMVANAVRVSKMFPVV